MIPATVFLQALSLGSFSQMDVRLWGTVIKEILLMHSMMSLVGLDCEGMSEMAIMAIMARNLLWSILRLKLYNFDGK